MSILGSSNSAANKDVDKRMAKWGYSYLLRVENMVGKGDIASNKQFLLFPQCFQKLSAVDASK